MQTEIIEEFRKRILIRFPLFTNTILNVRFCLTNDPVPADAFTDGRNIFYKSELLEESEEEIEFTFCHELLHIVLKHVFRNADKDPDLLNYVEDAVINQMLEKMGFKIPIGCVNIPDALDYSVEELYIRNLSSLEQIKSWMQANTYHIDWNVVQDTLDAIYNNDLNSLLNNAVTPQEILDVNQKMAKEALESYKEKLRNNGSISFGMEFPSIDYGTQEEMLTWRDYLAISLTICDSDKRTLYYETEMDGIIRRVEEEKDDGSETEIVIDSSGSMSMEMLKIILRECKNILKTSTLKIGFCDAIFYGWHEIDSESQIDELRIKGRGGTNFQVMADSFSADAINKIVITDGWGFFPEGHDDILWVIVNYYDNAPKEINHVHIDICELNKELRGRQLIKKPLLERTYNDRKFKSTL